MTAVLVVMVTTAIDTEAGRVVGQPDISTRGWIYQPGSESLLTEARVVLPTADGNHSTIGTAQ